VLGVLLKKYWPGLYRLKPLDETCLDKKLALKWEDYEAAHDESFGTCANAVITNFWVRNFPGIACCILHLNTTPSLTAV
jgi:hypothetical protein